MVQVAKSPYAVALYLATLRIGAVFVPLNTAYTPTEVDAFVEDAEPAVVVTGAANARPGSLILEADGSGTLKPGAGVEDVGRSGDDPAAMLYTSGTTGRSKGAVLTNDNLISNAKALVEAWRFHESDVLVHALPIFHVHGLFVALHCAMFTASTVVFLDRFDVGEVKRSLGDATVMMGVPTFYSRLLAAPEPFSGVRLFTSGSAPLTAATHREFEHRTGHAILERYGMTEAGMITSNPYEGARIPGTVGFALPGIEVRVTVDDAVAPPGIAGNVECRGPNVFSGYWRMPDHTAAAFTPDGWLRTGDIGKLDASGRLTLEGRASDMIISGGLNVYPVEVEQVLDAVPGVVEAAVVGLPHPDLGEAVTAFVTTDAAYDEQGARASLDAIARFKHPKQIVEIDALPRNAMGKVLKAELRSRYRSLFS